MRFMPSAFARLLEPLDRRAIARAVRAHDGDHGVGRGDKAWTCERHLKALLFSQFAGLTSLRQIEEALGHRRPHAGAARNPLYQIELREIVVARPDKDRPLFLLTNDFERPAAEIAALYKERWDIELLFKWIKQNLKIRSFLGRSENAVKIQIYVALIAFMLLRILHNTAARAVKTTTALFLAQLKTRLFAPLDLRRRSTPPPRPPNLRPPNPQFPPAFQ